MNTIFFKLAFRNILKNKISSTINIVGFSIGVAACLFIFLFVKYETGFDNFYPNSEKLYRIVGAFSANSDVSRSGFVWFPIAEDVKNEIPGIDDFCRISRESPAKCYVGNRIAQIDKLRYADSNFFRFFNLPLMFGNPETVLDSDEKIVLTQKQAKRLFGDENPLEKSVILDRKLFTVSGIVADPPSNTHLVFDAIASVKHIEQNDSYYLGYGGGMTFLSYLELSENVGPQQIEKALPDFLHRKINQDWKDTGTSMSASLQNITEVHLSDGTITYDNSTNRNKKSLYIIVGISVLILILAIINYIILFTAQKITKAGDFKILKIFGASRYGLAAQIYIEVLIIAVIASMLGILVLMTAAPFLNAHFQTSIFIEKNSFSVILFLLFVIFSLSPLVTFFSARQEIRPKAVESIQNTNALAVDPQKRLKGNLLISFQFTVVIVLLIAVFVVSRQNDFLLNAELGFDKENIVTLRTDEEFMNNELRGFKQDVKQLAEVRSVSLSSHMLGRGITQNGYRIGDEEQVSMVGALYTDPEFLECFKVELLSGRNFKKNNSLDKNAVLINKQLAERSGWEEPLDKKIERNGTLKVIGVVNDFNFASLENAVEPMLIMSNPAWDEWGYSVVNIRIQTGDIQNLLAEIDKLWKARFPETPVDVSFLDDILDFNYESFISQQKIINFFSLIGALIAVIGLFGLTFFTTRTRIKEIGIRKVNGAKIPEIIILLNRDFIKWIGIAFVIACPIAYYVMHKWLENFAYKTVVSWWIFVLAGVLTLVMAMLTVSWQSWKAASKNPADTLRNE